MLRKTYILSFIIIFFAANTGIPIALHFCEMMNATSLQNCSACEIKIEEISSCCEKTENSNLPSISKTESQCCSVILKDNALTDFYLTQQKKIDTLISFICLVSEFDDYSYNTKIELFNSDLIENHSPQEKTIYIFNSTFLI